MQVDKANMAIGSALSLLNLLDHADDVQFWIKDRTGAIQWANKALIEQYTNSGDPDWIRGKTDYDLEPSPLAEKALLDDRRILEGTPLIETEELATGPDHLIAWYKTTKVPLVDADGAIIGTIGMSRPRDPKPAGLRESGLLRVLAYIRENYQSRPANSLLALVLEKTEEALDLEFAANLKMSPQDYVRRVCVRLACRDLLHPEMSLNQIASKHGFVSSEEFTEEFKKEMGESPRVYRLNLYTHGAMSAL